ncbi:class I SAM-dependent methyltransferase [Streptomyces sp. NBS 14/10]|uniref:class I SAM-dependent methyltransferase n=1 Tax=Streptomyces sp. NBS 14/10 TaxID=1945643 RepID=UPI00211AA57A|nr:class I SAM-dependent methyltransferase [Streptomyces sp. NBS 14/10]KAK1182749.1 class I SAM-dependent methyltransferase [Streptomyces sp. NBS 14/10]
MVEQSPTSVIGLDDRAYASGAPTRRDDSVRTLVDFNFLSATTGEQKTVRAAHQIYEHLIGLWAPAVIEAAHDLGVFSWLANRPGTVEEMSAELETDQRATRVLLGGLLAYGVIERSELDGEVRYSLPSEFRQALLPGGTFSLVGKMLHDRHVAWAGWRNLGDAVRHGTRDQSGNDRTNQISEADYEDLTSGINFWAPPIVDVLSAALAETGWKKDEAVSVLDVGCGTGLYSQLLLERFPAWKAEGIDAPRIIRLATAQAERLGVGSRFTGTVRDFWKDGWGETVDLILFANIFHLQTPDSVQKLMRSAADVLAPDGLICIADQIVVDEARPVTAQDRFAMLFAASMLATGGGDAYTLSAYDQWLAEAGLERVAVLEAPMHRLLLIGHAGRHPLPA